MNIMVERKRVIRIIIPPLTPLYWMARILSIFSNASEILSGELLEGSRR